MSYSDFNVSLAKKNLNLTIQEINDLFAPIHPIAPSDTLQKTLAETLPLALAINTEKARSELIITPILLEIRRRFNNQMSFFSGTDFNVDPNQGLNGYCDFIISRSPEQLFIDRPVVMIVEAKNENIKAGLGQCIASIVAAQLFNQEQGIENSPIIGAVTTGDIWRFMELQGQTVRLDLSNVYLNQIDQILGILSSAIDNYPPLENC
ncbi:MAG: hypothetical protein ACKO1W_14015 [Microcystaceae cyanobacterium]